MLEGQRFISGNLNLSGMDISADLEELGKIPIMVVCAGVKSILDIGRTLEYLVGGYQVIQIQI